MEEDALYQKVQENLKQGEKFLDFLASQIKKSSHIKVSLRTLFTSTLEEEQARYLKFQDQYASWVRENFVLRRELLFAYKNSLEERRPLLTLLQDEANTLENLFDSWEDNVESHQTAQTNALKVTIPFIAVIISLLSFIIALTN